MEASFFHEGDSVKANHARRLTPLDYFIPVNVIPLMKYRWKSKKINKTGRVASTEPAMTSSQAVRFLTTYRAKPSCTVLSFSLLMTSIGQKKSFQTQVKVEMALKAMAGPLRGRAICQ